MEEIRKLKEMIWLLEMSDHYNEQMIAQLEKRVQALIKALERTSNK